MDADGVNERPNDTYYMIEINCKYRKSIKELETQVNKIYQKQMDITEQYDALQDKISNVGGSGFYKPAKGDIIDECFAQYLNAAQLDLPTRRIQPGRYQFGTK